MSLSYRLIGQTEGLDKPLVGIHQKCDAFHVIFFYSLTQNHTVHALGHSLGQRYSDSFCVKKTTFKRVEHCRDISVM